MSTSNQWGTPQGGAQRRTNGNPRAAGGCLTVVAVVVGLIIYAVVHSGGGSANTGSPAGGSATGSGDAVPSAAPSTDESISVGDCLAVGGSIPTDSTQSVDVSSIDKVACSDSNAQYVVVGVEPFSTDMNSCTTDFPSSTVSLLDQGPYISYVYCVKDNG